MPFGQSFWGSRIVGSIVEGITGDEELGKSARQVTRWGIAAVTFDLHTAAIDELIDAATDEVVDELEDSADEVLFGASYEFPDENILYGENDVIESADGTIYKTQSDFLSGTNRYTPG